MPRSCSVCTHERASEISKYLAQGGSTRSCQERFGVTHMSAGRHLRGCLKIVRSVEKRGQSGVRAKCSDSGRFETDGRCLTCQQLTGEGNQAMTPADICRRAERILHVSEGIAAQAQASDDSRLALQAVDRCQRSVDTLARIHGLVGSDVTISVQQTETLTLKKAFGLICNAIEGGEKRQAEFARICARFFNGEAYDLPFTGETLDQPALNPG